MKKETAINKLADELTEDFNFFMQELRKGNYYDTITTGLISAMYSGKTFARLKKLQKKVREECLSTKPKNKKNSRYLIKVKKNPVGVTSLELDTKESTPKKELIAWFKENYSFLEIQSIKKL